MFGKIKFCGLAAAAVPLLWQAPYLYRTWRISPLDRYDGIFFAAALLLAGCGWNKLRRWAAAPTAERRWDWVGLAAAIPVLAVGWRYDIHAIQIIGAIVFFGGAVQCLFGSRIAGGILPLLGLMLLGCPSSTYWLGFLLAAAGTPWLSPTGVKAVAGIALAIWFLGVRQPFPLRHAVFGGMLLLLGLLILAHLRPAEFGVPLRLNCDLPGSGSWLGAEDEVTALDRRFFQGAREIRRKYYFGEDTVVYLLAVKLGDDIHALHPAELCLIAAGNEVYSSRERSVSTRYGELAVNELLIGRDGRKFLVYQWNRGPTWSSGNFPALRRAWRPEDTWYSYLLLTPADGGRNDAEQHLDAFLNHFVEPPTDE